MSDPKPKAPKAPRKTAAKPKEKAVPQESVETKAEPAKVKVQQRSLRVIDNPGIIEQFSNQVLDVLLINGSTVSITMGAKRNVRAAVFGDRETVVAVNTRLTLDLQTAESLRNALNKVLLLARPTQGSVN